MSWTFRGLQTNAIIREDGVIDPHVIRNNLVEIERALRQLASTTVEQTEPLIQRAILAAQSDPVTHVTAAVSNVVTATPLKTYTYHKFGRNPDVDTGSVPEDVWAYGGEYVWATASGTLSLHSSSNQDTATGTNIRSVHLQGLDENYAYQTATASLNGAASASASGSWTRLFRARAHTGGSNHVLAGNFTVTHSNTGTPIAYIAAGGIQTNLALYTVPDGVTAQMLEWNLAAIGGAGAEVYAQLECKAATGDIWRVLSNKDFVTRAPYRINFKPHGLKISPKTDVRVRVYSVGANNIQIDSQFNLLLNS